METADLTSCLCAHCQGSIEFPYEYSGQVVECPHCHEQTELRTVAMRVPPPIRPVFNQAPKKKTSWLKATLMTFGAIGSVIGVIVGMNWLFGPDAGKYLFITFILAGGGCLYFLPSIIGRSKRNASAILLLNLCFGWTLIGWAVALVWAATKDPQER